MSNCAFEFRVSSNSSVSEGECACVRCEPRLECASSQREGVGVVCDFWADKPGRRGKSFASKAKGLSTVSGTVLQMSQIAFVQDPLRNYYYYLLRRTRPALPPQPDYGDTRAGRRRRPGDCDARSGPRTLVCRARPSRPFPPGARGPTVGRPPSVRLDGNGGVASPRPTPATSVLSTTALASRPVASSGPRSAARVWVHSRRERR